MTEMEEKYHGVEGLLKIQAETLLLMSRTLLDIKKTITEVNEQLETIIRMIEEKG
jgi:hypothetical protein